ncbi:hypothetical protein [Streptomyces sp. NPDC006270]|uniref:hypothetical protein n=1 Tax=Streptomyces sp. NPDC006270 TaxID=3364741 RepID=UPI003675D72B
MPDRLAARGALGAPLAAEFAPGGRTVSHVSADLGSLAGVRSAADEIRGRLDPGVRVPPRAPAFSSYGRAPRPEEACAAWKDRRAWYAEPFPRTAGFLGRRACSVPSPALRSHPLLPPGRGPAGGTSR